MKNDDRKRLRLTLLVTLALMWLCFARCGQVLAYGTGGDISIFTTPDNTKVDLGFGILDEFDTYYLFLDKEDSVFDNILIPHTPTLLPPNPWNYASNEPGFDAFVHTLPAIKPLTVNLLDLGYWNGTGAVNFLPAPGVTAGDAPQPMLTQASGGFHAHPFFGVAGASVPDGIYLAKLSISIQTLLDSDPYYMVALVDHRLYTGDEATDIENADGLGDVVHANMSDPTTTPEPLFQGNNYQFYVDAIRYAESLAVPEPSTVGLLLTAGFGLLSRRSYR